MVDIKNIVVRRMINYYKNVKRNTSPFCMNLMFYNFHEDFILILIKTYMNILKKYESYNKTIHLLEEYYMLFNYVILSYIPLYVYELDINNLYLFDMLLHKFNEKRKRENNMKKNVIDNNIYKKYRILNRINKNGHVEANKLHCVHHKNVEYMNINKLNKHMNICFNDNKCDSIYSLKKQTSEDIQKNEKQNDKLILPSFQGSLKKNIYMKNNTNRRICETNLFYKNNNNDHLKLKKNRSPIYLCEDNLKKRKDIIKNMIKEMDNLYAHVYYWKYLTELNIKCNNNNNNNNDKNNNLEVNYAINKGQDIYLNIYKNIYNLYKYMNKKHKQNLEKMNMKKEQLSITHNNEMENIINEKKIHKKNEEYHKNVNDMVFKHIAEKNALCRHIEHEMNIIQQINMKEYKENIFYIFSIISKNKQNLSLPPLPVEEERDIQKEVRPYHNEEKKKKHNNNNNNYNNICNNNNNNNVSNINNSGCNNFNNMCENMNDLSKHKCKDIKENYIYNDKNNITMEDKIKTYYHIEECYYHYKYIIKCFHFKYLYELIKSKIMIYNYLHFHIKKSLYNIMNVSIIFSLGEIYHIFEYDKKKNIQFQDNFFTTLRKMQIYNYNKYYQYNMNNEKGPDKYFNSFQIYEEKKKKVTNVLEIQKDEDILKKDVNTNEWANPTGLKKKILHLLKGGTQINKDNEHMNKFVPIYNNSLLVNNILSGYNAHDIKEQKRDDSLKCEESFYFDENGYFKYKKKRKGAKEFFNHNYSSTYNYINNNNTLYFMNNKMDENIYNNNNNNNNNDIKINKLTIKDKKLNCLILFINEDISNYTKENVYNNIFNISLTKMDFIFPTIKEQLHVVKEMYKGKKEKLFSDDLYKKSIKNICNDISEKNESLSYGTIIITRHKNLKIAMQGKNNFKENHQTGDNNNDNNNNKNNKNDNNNNNNNKDIKNKEENNIYYNNHNLDNLNYIPFDNFFFSLLNMPEQVMRTSHFSINEKMFPKKKKKKIYIDIIFHVLIPKKINRKSFKIILFSLFKILDLCKLYNIYCINCSFPYVHDIVYKNKRPIIYSFIYSFIMTIMKYIKKGQPEDHNNTVRIFHFIFPPLQFYEKLTTEQMENKNDGKNQFKENINKNYDNKENNINYDYIHNVDKTKISNITYFIDKLIHDLKEKYMLIESI
ncbi:hypothetical protein PFNF135_04081 [Plasmodium falciparum NF135/5.C10]|uniref:Uncharacterized protein n=3 Tax=Plasmodium falciparum TaxID=5833 RepID=A0A0L7LXE0_PLAF4|nr:hypothetical protein PFFVO_03537 [Plasmodium falciparum Vietnam Oak-Knoll (FVO)]ETW41432.1 hypothetical protein PFNF135_04081 [Plasmodium falciparum NF135/5.C10]KOB85326.1 hypothetical protein PFDG_00790 [Plasmodium falciparum Dd2]